MTEKRKTNEGFDGTGRARHISHDLKEALEDDLKRRKEVRERDEKNGTPEWKGKGGRWRKFGRR